MARVPGALYCRAEA